MGSSAGACEHGVELSCHKKGREFLDYLSNYQFFKTGLVPRIRTIHRLIKHIFKIPLFSSECSRSELSFTSYFQPSKHCLHKHH